MATASPASSHFWRGALLIFLGVLVLSIPQAALLPLLDRDEPRFAEASREMLQSGNYIVPTFNGEPRYAKPPLIYWCQAFCFWTLGQSAFTARLPSLLATAGTALLLFMWGVRLGSRHAGLIAALGYAFSFQAMQQGRVATADAALIFFMTLTGYTGWKLLHHEPPPKDAPAPRSVFRTGSTLRAWTFRFVVALAAGFLAKGPEAWLPVVVLLICARDCGARVFFFGWFLASLVLVALWGIPACLATHGDYLRVGLGHDVGDRMIGGDFQGHDTSSLLGYVAGVLFYYTLLLWLSALPWSPLLLTHGKKLFGGWHPDDADRYLLLNAGIIFVVFSLGATKLPHYTLPALPFLALFFARRWTGAGLSMQLPVRLTGGMGIAFAVLALIGIPLALHYGATPSPVGVLVKEAKDAGALTPDTQVALVDFKEPNTVWETRRVVSSYVTVIPQSDVETWLDGPGRRAVIMSAEALADIKSNEMYIHSGPGPSEPPSWAKRMSLAFFAHGFNAAKINPLHPHLDVFVLLVPGPENHLNGK